MFFFDYLYEHVYDIFGSIVFLMIAFYLFHYLLTEGLEELDRKK